MTSRTRENLAWAAGFFDGEGHVQSRSGSKVSLGLQIGNTDLPLLERFRDIVGLGKIYGPFQKKAPEGSIHKPYWTWNVRRFQHTQAVSAMLWNWLGDTRQQQIVRMLNSRGPGRWPRKAAD